ncbi:MAG: GvpL/GvpF family gas vesicle protein [Candidatus Angelobacter sp.]
MIRALPYCAYLEDPEISISATGVNGAAIKVFSAGRLRVPWSEVEWPFAPEKMQSHAVEFHNVVSLVFTRRAVAPFRLLSVFESQESLFGFVNDHAPEFVKDLERLRDCVQMECVLYFVGDRGVPDASSGLVYLQRKAETLSTIEGTARQVEAALRTVAEEVRTKQVKSGRRVFALVRRGEEDVFRRTVLGVALPEGVSRRTSGPWPASEFLSEAMKFPQQAGAK